MSRPLQTGSLYIVSEGEKTEASFYDDLQQQLKLAGCSHFSKVDFYRVPKPKDITDDLPDFEVRTEGGRALNRPANAVMPKGTYQPLNWIKIAIGKLGAYDEAWAVFDNDHRNNPPSGKPQIDNAIAAYQNLFNGGSHPNLCIAYSSLSFEYYMLLHFEYLYHGFHNTECYDVVKGNHVYRNCCSNDPKNPPKQGACNGQLQDGCCINGYARLRNYWQLSKTNGVLSCIPNIYTGIVNAARVRWEALQTQRGTTIGNKMPYLNTYQLTIRMMGLQLLEYDHDITIVSKSGLIILHLEENKVKVDNQSNILLLIPEIDTPVYEIDSTSLMGKQHIDTLGRLFVQSNSVGEFDITPLANNGNHFAIINIHGSQVMVTSIPKPNPEITAVEYNQVRLTAN